LCFEGVATTFPFFLATSVAERGEVGFAARGLSAVEPATLRG